MRNKSKNRYEQILERSFKSDIERFLFECVFFKTLSSESLKEEYERFEINLELEEKYLSSRQLTKDDDVIDYRGIQQTTKSIDDLFREWYKNKIRLNEYKGIFQSSRFLSYEDFISFYDNEGVEKRCHYCDITETKIEELISKNKIYTKRLLIRGRSLEIDKKNPNGKYDKENMVLCCYWCNNAKTDEFTQAEFLPIGNQIKEIWKKRF